MKKNILNLAVLVAALAFALPSQAQIKFGIKTGLNVNSFSVKNLPGNVDKKNRNGFFAGVTADVTVPIVGLGADISLLYDNRCIGLGGVTEYEDYYEGVPEVTSSSYTKTHKTFHYISLPINAKYTFGLSSLASVYVATGPQFSWNIGDRHWSMGDWDDGWELKSSQFSWNVGCGATVLSHVRVGYNYNIALGNTAEIRIEDEAQKLVKGKLKNNTHQISLTYLF